MLFEPGILSNVKTSIMKTFLSKTEEGPERRIVGTKKGLFSLGEWVHTAKGQRVTKEGCLKWQ
jgi:hypothetical protein